MRKALEDLKRYDIKNAENKLNTISSSPEKELLEWNIKVLKFGNNDTTISNKASFNSTFEEVLTTIKNADIYINRKVPNDSLSFSYYQKAFLDSKSINDSLLIQFSMSKLISHMYFRYTQTLKTIPSYVEEYRLYANNKSDLATVLFYDLSVDAAIKRKPQISGLKKAVKIAQESGNKFIEGKLHQMIGIQYNYFLKERDSAFHNYSKAAKIFQPLPYAFAQYEMFNLNSNFALIKKEEKKYKEAIAFLNLAKSNKLPNNSYLRKKKLYTSLSKIYRQMKQYDSAFYYNDLEKSQTDSLNGYKNALTIREINTKYQTVEKEKRIVQLLNTNLKTEASRIRNRNFLIGSISILIVGFIIALLIYKNTRRKQRIAEQERQIEIQKTEKLLKDQELTDIDAMISGQEKERQRLANELHDNLGSTLATVKLHFQHLTKNRNNSKIENLEELYAKTDHLLEEAYQKVRTIAHEKNSGVMANQGLLPAIKKFAKKASNGDALQIVVQDYGLEERLDNALEISIFRMIQELITNIIKHANATEVHISLTNHDSLLNIIIEDNGKGFDTKVISQKDGMGLRTIEKRIEHLEGTFEIDSTIGKGTNIIINIPI
ncbi:sensor histidine kinase [Aquimarina algiphila]|uniref:sensor histidine kinase n=1 Tax=Aquimarina algiphila TaxID=2047982 RepID=UPI00232F7FCC|nr:sensor histidine kinase [Aquimarina algiphila]